MASATLAHSAGVARSAGRYPFVPTCSCGWTTWGYVAHHAAAAMADAHREEAHAEQATA